MTSSPGSGPQTAPPTAPPAPHTGPHTARVVIVDDHGALAQTLTVALRAEGLRVERCTQLTAAAITGVVAAARPELVLLDLDLGGELGSSLPLVGPLVASATSVVMLTGVTDRVQLAACVRAGAVGIIAKSAPFDALVAGVRRVLAVGSLLTDGQREEYLAELRRHDAERDRRLACFERLTPREAQMLDALLDGKTAEQVAGEWVVAMSTVRTQIRNLLTKLGVNSQLAAVVLAQKAGWRPDTR